MQKRKSKTKICRRKRKKRSSRILYALRAMPCATSSQFHTTRGRVDSIPSLRTPQKLAHSLRGTPTAAWINKKELSKKLLFVGRGSWIRTNECKSQSLVPYRLAIPLYLQALPILAQFFSFVNLFYEKTFYSPSSLLWLSRASLLYLCSRFRNSPFPSIKISLFAR